MANVSLQDQSLVNTALDKIIADGTSSDRVSAFYFFTMNEILGLQPNEIDDSITDSNYLKLMGRDSGHDRGIDAIYIDDNTSPSTVHLFNCKYTEKFEKLDSHFPSGEIDKITGFIGAIMQQDTTIRDHINPVLFDKVEEIWDLYRNQSPDIVIHLCSNLYNQMETNENKRLVKELSKYSQMTIKYHLMESFISGLTKKDTIQVDARIRASSELLFEKTDGDVRALVLNVNAQDLVRIVLEDDELRQNVEVEDYSVLKDHLILEDAFEDNVRIYLRQRSKINRNIKETALSEMRNRFFYFNNGITMTCDSFSFPKIKYPVIDISNLQVVNGSQTIHALFDAFQEDPSCLEDIDVLCRIYETKTEEITEFIAEYTNSQNPVRSRDIRSNDYIQKKLEKELGLLGYFYERKKNQHRGQERSKRIDADYAGQAIMAFFCNMPSEAKDKKALIFSEKYEDVFSDEITASKLLLAVGLLDHIEGMKTEARTRLLKDPTKYEEDAFTLHSSFYILHTLKLLAGEKDIKLELESLDTLKDFYDESKGIVKKAVESEIKSLKKYKENYTHRVFFKGNRPKEYIGKEFQRRKKKK